MNTNPMSARLHNRPRRGKRKSNARLEALLLGGAASCRPAGCPPPYLNATLNTKVMKVKIRPPTVGLDVPKASMQGLMSRAALQQQGARGQAECVGRGACQKRATFRRAGCDRSEGQRLQYQHAGVWQGDMQVVTPGCARQAGVE